MRKVDKEVLAEFISHLTVKQTGKLFKAVVAYVQGEDYEQYLNENTKATFVLLVNMID